jgi:hypothetical protein
MKVALPSHDLIVIGFDSGELQVYRGIDETGSEAPEPGKKNSDSNCKSKKKLDHFDK